MITINDEGAMFDLLDQRNQDGHIPTVVGFNRDGDPFLAYLAGIDGDRGGFITDDPRAAEYDIDGVRRCEDCGSFEERGIDALRYPVTIAVAPPSPATEAVTEPEARRWCVDGCVIPAVPGPGHSDYTAESLVAWINANGGEARYERAKFSHEAVFNPRAKPQTPARIVITGPDGTERFMAPGDEAVMGDEWFGGEQDGQGGWLDHGFCEFTVRRPEADSGVNAPDGPKSGCTTEETPS